MSSRRFITQGEGLPQWSMPISHAVVVGSMCFVENLVMLTGDDVEQVPVLLLPHSRLSILLHFIKTLNLKQLEQRLSFSAGVVCIRGNRCPLVPIAKQWTKCKISNSDLRSI